MSSYEELLDEVFPTRRREANIKRNVFFTSEELACLISLLKEGSAQLKGYLKPVEYATSIVQCAPSTLSHDQHTILFECVSDLILVCVSVPNEVQNLTWSLNRLLTAVVTCQAFTISERLHIIQTAHQVLTLKCVDTNIVEQLASKIHAQSKFNPATGDHANACVPDWAARNHPLNENFFRDVATVSTDQNVQSASPLNLTSRQCSGFLSANHRDLGADAYAHPQQDALQYLPRHPGHFNPGTTIEMNRSPCYPAIGDHFFGFGASAFPLGLANMGPANLHFLRRHRPSQFHGVYATKDCVKDDRGSSSHDNHRFLSSSKLETPIASSHLDVTGRSSELAFQPSFEQLVQAVAQVLSNQRSNI
ncbi:hypothetical protein IE53DRAFT_388052 [Violaceomyces palustris]|uniref:Uncharacterized protein n=1 Tax=Violaceomyces palustris TaxID=1673888 RepID=A0ACD0NV60_9BASI|nr:hypothetical protein IE53DRAFT_388052 [Violaceomyces palustris]